MREEEKIAKAKRQLLIVGVICVTAVVFTLWAVNLGATFARNRRLYPPTASLLRISTSSLGESWQRFTSQLQQIRK